MAKTRATKKEVKKEEEGSDVDEGTLDSPEDATSDLPPKCVESMQRKMLIGKASCLSRGLSLYSLRHPRFGTPALFQLGEHECAEVLLLEDEYRCLFHGDAVISDGAARLLSPFNPLFLVLPYLERKKARYETLEEILVDEEWPAIERLAENEQAMGEMERVAERTDACDEVLYKYSESKAMAWLGERFAALKRALVEHARLHDSITGSAEVLDRYAFGVLADHLTPSMAAAAREQLGIKEAPMAEAAPEPLGLKRKLDDDENLYSTAMPPTKKTPTQSATQKRLAAASKGTKGIGAFFAKKQS